MYARTFVRYLAIEYKISSLNMLKPRNDLFFYEQHTYSSYFHSVTGVKVKKNRGSRFPHSYTFLSI